MADQELTDLEVLAALAPSDLLFTRDVSAGIDKQVAASALGAFLNPVDFQASSSSTTLQTTSTTFIDIPGLTLTTKDLSGTGTYLFGATGIVEHQGAMEEINFLVLQNGVPVTVFTGSGGFPVTSVFANTRVTFSVIGVISGVSNGDVFKVQWKQNATAGQNTATLTGRSMTLYGINDSQIVT